MTYSVKPAMSISYVDDISDGRGIFIFVKLLTRWKGSLYKLVWIDLLMYIAIYYLLNLSYRFAMTDSQKETFQDIVKFCEHMKASIPISFLLGFFVSGVIARWYQMYLYIPWLNKTAFMVMACLNNRDDEFIRNARLTVLRYLNLSWILMMRQISDQIATRFETKQEKADKSQKSASKKSHRRRMKSFEKNLNLRQKIVKNINTEMEFLKQETQNKRPDDTTPISKLDPVAKEGLVTFMEDPQSPIDPEKSLQDPFEPEDNGSIRHVLESLNEDYKVKNTFGKLITNAEIEAFENISHKCFAKNRVRYKLEYWVPLQWAVRVIQKCTLHGMVADPKISFALIDDIGKYRNQMQDLQIYSSIMIPLVYTQVVIIAAYSYFVCQLFSSQFIKISDENQPHRVDFYIPIFSIFSFLFLMGWLKVAMCVMNPFGDDDEDFQTSDILDYNLEVSYRCGLCDSDTYPPGLSAPNCNVRLLPGHEEDDLFDYLQKARQEIDQHTGDTGDDVKNLIVKPCFSDKLRHFWGSKNWQNDSGSGSDTNSFSSGMNF